MSLLTRAKQIRRGAATDASATELDIVFDTSSGISEEDQKDILAQIESVARKNRISAAPEALTVRARKRGVVFPVVVNFGAFALLAAGLFTLSSFFRQSETELRRESAGMRSAEGRLIQAIKKETEARIQAKEAEINSITARLGEIDRERRDLQSTMDDRVMRKEEELRTALEAELAEERKRLTAQGLSEAVIAERMKKFEEQKTAEFNAELAAFKTQVEAERVAAEDNLRKLQADFQNNLAALNSERTAILADSRKREDALRAQLEERTRALESADAESRERLSQAQTELRRLGEQKERAALVENQILGFYTAAGNHLRAGSLAEARASLAAMKDFLNEPSILAIPEIQTRRAVDITVADAMMSMIDENLLKARQTLSISQALQTGPLIDEIRKTTAEADAARQAGNIPEAERLYTAALSRVPEVLSSHEYFVRKLQAEDEARRGAAQEALTRAETAFAAGNYPEAWDGYARVLEYLPLPRDAGAAAAANIRKTGYEILSAEQKDLESRSAAGLLAEGGSHFAGARYEQAAAAYVTLLQRYPQSEQTPEALEGIRRTVDAQNDLIGSRGSAASSTLAALQAEKAAVEASLRRQNADLRAEYDARIAAMSAQIAELRNRPVVDAAAAQTVPQAAQEELRRLAAVEAEFGRVKSSYADYAAKEDGVLRARGEAGIVEAKLLLDTFLASESIRTHFPGFDGRIKRYDKAFQAAGAGEALMQASDIAFRLSSYGSKAEMDRYLAAELARQRNNPAMKEYLETLQEFTR